MHQFESLSSGQTDPHCWNAVPAEIGQELFEVLVTVSYAHCLTQEERAF